MIVKVDTEAVWVLEYSTIDETKGWSHKWLGLSAYVTLEDGVKNLAHRNQLQYRQSNPWPMEWRLRNRFTGEVIPSAAIQ